MPKIAFLTASIPLTKRFSVVNKKVVMHPYPHVRDFTSKVLNISDLRALYEAIRTEGKKGACLLKGTLNHALNDESRAGSTTTDATTEWVCLDFDRAPFKTPAEAMRALKLDDMAYVVQYSSSMGLKDAKGLSCHVFMLLNHPYAAPYLKTWLMRLNLETPELRQALELTKSNAYLHWPLDITACQNDKLIYVAPPTVDKGVEYKDRPVEFVAGKTALLDVKRLVSPALEALKKQASEILNAKRQESGLDKLRAQTKWVGEHEVQAKPGEAQITGIKTERGFTYFNLNGGDSWGYYHPENSFELIHNFKGEPSYLTKELLPGYYKDQLAKQRRVNETPTEDGSLVAAICERRSGKYWKLEWNPETKTLRLDPARSELQLEHFLNSFGRSLNGEFIPQWDIVFDPRYEMNGGEPWVVNEEMKRINTYVPPRFEHLPKKVVKDIPPTIKQIMRHAIGTGEIWEWSLNWITCIVKEKVKTRVALTLSGNYGTGKSVFASRIMAPLLGARYVAFKRNRELEDKFIGWMEDKLLVSVDEAMVGHNNMKEAIHQELKNWITEPTIDIRRMNTDTYSVPSFVNFLFCSNMDAPVYVDEKDRRHNFGDYQPEPLPPIENMLEKIEAELEDFWHYIQGRTADVEYAAKIIKNATRQSVVEANLNSIDVVANALKKGNIELLMQSMPDMNLLAELRGTQSAGAAAFASILMRETALLYKEGVRLGSLTERVVKLESKLSRDELMVIFDYCVGNTPITPNKFTRMIKHHGLDTTRIWTAAGSTYGIHVTWQAPLEWVEDHKPPAPKEKEMKLVKGGKK